MADTRYLVALAKGAGLTQSQAAAQIGISRERVRQLANEMFGGWPCRSCKRITHNGICRTCKELARIKQPRSCVDCGAPIAWSYSRRCGQCLTDYNRARDRERTREMYQRYRAQTPPAKRQPWTAEEDAAVLAASGKGEVVAVAVRFERSYASVVQRIAHLRYPGRRRVYRRVQDAIKRGVLVRPDRCSRCHKPCKPGAHHEDYTKPLEVVWLCALCHKEVDRGLEKVEAPASVPRASTQTHCQRGHEWTDENTFWQGPQKRNRVCRTCQRMRARQYYQKKKAAAAVTATAA